VETEPEPGPTSPTPPPPWSESVGAPLPPPPPAWSAPADPNRHPAIRTPSGWLRGRRMGRHHPPPEPRPRWVRTNDPARPLGRRHRLPLGGRHRRHQRHRHHLWTGAGLASRRRQPSLGLRRPTPTVAPGYRRGPWRYRRRTSFVEFLAGPVLQCLAGPPRGLFAQFELWQGHGVVEVDKTDFDPPADGHVLLRFRRHRVGTTQIGDHSQRDRLILLASAPR
jgi:hypothetical protein